MVLKYSLWLVNNLWVSGTYHISSRYITLKGSFQWPQNFNYVSLVWIEKKHLWASVSSPGCNVVVEGIHIHWQVILGQGFVLTCLHWRLINRFRTFWCFESFLEVLAWLGGPGVCIHDGWWAGPGNELTRSSSLRVSPHNSCWWMQGICHHSSAAPWGQH